jgi:putative Holliday junction resolvase
MPRIMALDVGEKTIGVAFSDETERLAFPGETIWRQEGKKRDMAALRQLIAERQVREIVVGLPLMKDGTRGIQAEKVEAFIALLRNSVRIPIVRQDERYTTAEAQSLLLEMGKKREAHKATIDSIAACLILQDYLEHKRRSASGEEAGENRQGRESQEQ